MRFPLKTALATATCLLALAAWRHWRDGSKGIAPAIFAEAWQLHLHHGAAAPTVPLPQEHQPLTATETTHPTTARPAISEVLFDDTGALDPLYAALAHLEATQDATHVAILHYGDSPTTADLITGDVRALLQQRFGDAGHGYLLVAKPWAWYGHRDTDITSHGWTIANAVGKMRPDTYGLGGASFTGTDAASHITLKGAPQSAMELAFLAQPDGGTIALTADSDAGAAQPLATIPTAAPTPTLAWQTVALPPGTRAVDIKATSGRVTLFGENFTRAQHGLLYDSLGLNGASTTVLSRGFNAELWTAELKQAAPGLVIINYGTNESSFGAFVDKQYEPELRAAIARIRAALPSVSILVMSPMDRGERSGIDQIETMATLPRIVAIQKRVAADTHSAFFDTFNAMGGDGTMSRWYTGKPRLVAADLIHPTPQGAAIVAQIFVKHLILGYDRYQASQPAPHAKQAAQP